MLTHSSLTASQQSPQSCPAPVQNAPGIKWKSCMNAEIKYGFYSKLIWVSKTNKVPQISIDDTCSGKGFFPAAQTWNDTGGCVKDLLTLKRIYLLWHWQPVHVWKERRYSYRLCVLTTNMTDTPGFPKIHVVFISLLLAVLVSFPPPHMNHDSSTHTVWVSASKQEWSTGSEQLACSQRQAEASSDVRIDTSSAAG